MTAENDVGQAALHVLKTTCIEGKHDWTGPVVEHELPEGGAESSVTCAKCGMLFSHYALHTFWY